MIHSSSLQEFFHMGGYAKYVWPAYAVVSAGMLGLLWHSQHKQRKIKKILQNRKKNYLDIRDR